MNDQLQSLLVELEQFGSANDSATGERSRKMLNITRDTGELLAVLVRATVARRVLEIGTSNGYSTLWLASAAQAIGGSVTTIELSDYKIALATKNFARSGLASFITSIQGDAGRALERTADSAFDFLFLDAERPEYPGWWPNVNTCLAPVACLWWTTPLLTLTRWRRSSLSWKRCRFHNQSCSHWQCEYMALKA